MRRWPPPVVAMVLGSLLGAGCTRAADVRSGSPAVERTSAHLPTRPATSPPGPIVAGPTTARVTTCPLLDTGAAAAAIGVRLGRVIALFSGGKPVGCRFYAVQDPTYRISEHLPGPDQPVLQIVLTRYSDATTAHNSLVRLAKAGSNPYQDSLSPQLEGIAFQTTFDPADGNHDWAYAFRKDVTVIVVNTAQRDTAFDARAAAAEIANR